MAGRFENRVALVTGGSRGIGRAVVQLLVKEGADVSFSYATREDAAREVVASTEESGRKVIYAPCDVSKPGDVDRLVSRTRDELGPIDLLVHCGAVSNLRDHTELTYEDWCRTIDVNLNGTYLVVFAVKDEMLRRQYGRIVTISSVAALRGRQLQAHYSASKAGVIAFTKCCAEGFAPHVRMNCIAPGLIDTEMAHVFSDEELADKVEVTPLKRLGQPEDIASLAAFLLSDEASFMTGQTVVASGGRVLLP